MREFILNMNAPLTINTVARKKKYRLSVVKAKPSHFYLYSPSQG